MLPDTKEVFFVEMSNGNLSNIKVDKTLVADATLYINRSDVTKTILKQTTLKALFVSKRAGLEGDQAVLNKLLSALVEFDETFEIVPRPEKGQEVDAQLYH